MSFFTKTTQKENHGLFGSKPSNQDPYGSEYDTEPEGGKGIRRTPSAGDNDSDSAQKSSIFVRAPRKHKRQPPSGSEDDLAGPAKKPSIFGFRPSKQEGISGGSDYDAEMTEEPGKEDSAEIYKGKYMREIGRPNKVPKAVSSTPQASTRARSDPPDDAVNLRLIKIRRKKLEALKDQEARKAEEEEALDLKKKDLEKRQADVGRRQEALNKMKQDVSETKGHISGIEFALGVQ